MEPENPNLGKEVGVWVELSRGEEVETSTADCERLNHLFKLFFATHEKK